MMTTTFRRLMMNVRRVEVRSVYVAELHNSAMMTIAACSRSAIRTVRVVSHMGEERESRD
jgi:hypothetical protein